MSKPYLKIAASLAAFGLSTAAQAQWLTFTNQTSTRMPTGAGQNNPATSTADPEEKHYAWADFDKDGDIDLVVVRKTPFTFAGGKPGVLFMNENGVLIDRTSTLAFDSSGIPAGFTSLGLADACNSREVRACDVNHDGWLDLVTCNTIADGEQKYIGHPRIYINKGEVGGVWQGFRFENDRIPQMLSKSGVVANPRFCDVGVGDVNADGYVDLYFSDYDTGEVGPPESGANDFDNKLLINQGAANPGYFVDESVARMGSMFSYPGVGSKNLLYATFGSAGLIYDMNGDGIKDVVKDTTLNDPIHVAVMTNPTAAPGIFPSTSYKIVYNGAPYFISADDLNGDGKMDLVVTDDSPDRYLLNTGNATNGSPNFSSKTFSFGAGQSDPGFSTKSTIVDLNNDGYKEVIIADVDLDTFGCSRQSHIYHNLGNVPNVTLKEEVPLIIPAAMVTGVYQFAVFDINGDGWKDMVIGRCNTTEVWIQTPQPSLAITYPNGRPTTLSANAPAVFQVLLTGADGGTPLANSAKIYTSVNGATFTSTVATSLGGNLYEVTIPAQPCGTNVRYYLSGQLSTNAVFTDPAKADASNNYAAPATGGTAVAIDEHFEAGSTGWTVSNDASLTSGGWEAADPNATWVEGQLAAPEDDATPGGTIAFVTGNGAPGGALAAANVDGGPTYLVSPVIDLTGSNAVISYARWFFTSTPGDVMTISVSNDDGANWTVVGTYAGPKLPESNFFNGIIQNSWNQASFTVGDFVTPTSLVRVRFSVNDVAPAGIVEGGIDDFHVEKFICSIPCPADINSTGAVDIDDLLAVINSWGRCKGCPADVNGTGTVDIDDLLSVINAWGSCP